MYPGCVVMCCARVVLNQSCRQSRQNEWPQGSLVKKISRRYCLIVSAHTYRYGVHILSVHISHVMCSSSSPSSFCGYC